MENKDLLAKAIYRCMMGQLLSPNAVFDFLFDAGFFDSKQSTDAFVNMVCAYFPISNATAQCGFRTRMLEKFKQEPLLTKLPTVKEVFAYMDTIGFFFDDAELRAFAIHSFDQLWQRREAIMEKYDNEHKNP